jgi:phosphoribosylanthranilate isomerase
VVPASQFFDEHGELLGVGLVRPGKTSQRIDAIFLDSGTPQQPGGTGQTFDWEQAAPLVALIGQLTNVVVAGGLTPANVTEAIRILKPWGVDVASGVEAKPGKKDPEKVRAFVAAVRQADKTA